MREIKLGKVAAQCKLIIHNAQPQTLSFFNILFLLSSFISNINAQNDSSSIRERWRILSENNWEGLLDPLDMDLRRYILHYGDLAETARDAFNSEEASRYAGSSRYAKRNLFARVGFANPFKYQETKYFYATSYDPIPEGLFVFSRSREAWSKESDWMGFVAVASDEGKVLLGRRDIVIAWRGATREIERRDVVDFVLVPATKIFGTDNINTPMVGRGWYSIYTSPDPLSPSNKDSARDQVLAEVGRLLEQYKGEEISITVIGHSLGATLATLTAVDIVYNGINKDYPVTAFLSGSPKVGDWKFKTIFSSLANLRALHVRNVPDLLPKFPPLIGYADNIGIPLDIDTTKSFYLKFGSPRKWHHPDVYMHGIAGTQGINGGFKLEVKRDISLVNKYLDALKDEYSVPVSWWLRRIKVWFNKKMDLGFLWIMNRMMTFRHDYFVLRA